MNVSGGNEASRHQGPRITTHALDLWNPTGNSLTLDDMRRVMEIPGVYRVACDIDKGQLEATYDLAQLNLAVIEGKLLELGFIRKRDFYHDLKYRLIHYMEQGEMKKMR